MDRKYLSTIEAAKILGISRVAVFKRIKSGKIKAKKIGRNFVVDRKELGEVLGEALGESRKRMIDEAVKRTVREYGETLRLLGQE